MESSIDGPQLTQTDRPDQSDSEEQLVMIFCLMCYGPHKVTLLASSCFFFFFFFQSFCSWYLCKPQKTTVTVLAGWLVMCPRASMYPPINESHVNNTKKEKKRHTVLESGEIIFAMRSKLV